MRKSYLFLVVLSSMVFFHPNEAAAKWQNELGFDVAIGVGVNAYRDTIQQEFITPSVSWRSGEYNFLRYRVEVSLDVIDDGNGAIVAGVAPALRCYTQTGRKWRPFFDLSAGVNYLTRNEIDGRKMDGPLVASLVQGIGVEFDNGDGSHTCVSTRIKHFSNGGLYKNNRSFNAVYLMVSIGWQ